jgi:hypothetical protein
MLDDILIVSYLALAYRIRGHRPNAGWGRVFMHPVFSLRPFWALSVFGVVFYLTGDPLVSGLVAFGEWLGLHIPHSKGQNLRAPPLLPKLLKLAEVGMFRGLIVFCAAALPFTIALVQHYVDFALPLGFDLSIEVSFYWIWALIPALYAVTYPAFRYLGSRVDLNVPYILRGWFEWMELFAGAGRALVFLIVFGGNLA